MLGVDAFEELVRKAFSFLEGEVGFKFGGVSAHLPELWATYSSVGGCKVVVFLEAGGAPWVEISFPDPSASSPSQRTNASLTTLVRTVRGEQASALEADDGEGATGDESCPAVLKAKASLLKEYGLPVLLGDSKARARVAAAAAQDWLRSHS